MDQFTCVKTISSTLPTRDMAPVLLSNSQHAIPVSDLGPILVTSPHPDDETLGCGGLIAHCASFGYPLSVLTMTNGDASHPGDRAWRDKLGKIRQREQRNALKALGLRHPDSILLELPDGELDQFKGEMRKRIVSLIADVIHSRNIRTLFVPAIDDCHGDHRETARLLLQAASGASTVRSIFSYQIWPPGTRLSQIPASETEYNLDISSVLALKRRAIHEHSSQLTTMDTAHAEGFRIPQALLEDKLRARESFALIHDIPAWSREAQ